MFKQISFLKKEKSEYGGELSRTRRGRKGPRPISTKWTMHLVLRSSRAKGAWSFLTPRHKSKIKYFLRKFSQKFGVKVIKLAIVGNHLHLHIKLLNRQTYRPFIRAFTAAIAMAVTGACRWRPALGKFWDLRPFTRIVESFQAFVNLEKYISINQLEALGFFRAEARRVLSGDGPP